MFECVYLIQSPLQLYRRHSSNVSDFQFNNHNFDYILYLKSQILKFFATNLSSSLPSLYGEISAKLDHLRTIYRYVPLCYIKRVDSELRILALLRNFLVVNSDVGFKSYFRLILYRFLHLPSLLIAVNSYFKINKFYYFFLFVSQIFRSSNYDL